MQSQLGTKCQVLPVNPTCFVRSIAKLIILQTSTAPNFQNAKTTGTKLFDSKRNYCYPVSKLDPLSYYKNMYRLIHQAARPHIPKVQMETEFL